MSLTAEAKKITVESTEEGAKRSKKNFTIRSSAIFYAAAKNGIDTEITFLNHFLLKRGIAKVIAYISFRDLTGSLRYRQHLEVKDPRSYTFRASELCGNDFEGSAEVEFYSIENLFVPFSAVSALYTCEKSICQMHSYARTYNSHELEEAHVISIGEEAGWTLRDHAEDVESVAYFHNGPNRYVTGMTIELANASGAKHLIHIPEGEILPFSTIEIIPSRHFDVKSFLNGAEGQAAVSFKTSGFFPRMLVGNRRRNASGQVSEFQATHSNFNFAKIDTPRLAPGETGYSYVPTIKTVEKIDLIVTPYFLRTSSIKMKGANSEAVVSENKGTSLRVAPSESVEFSTSDPRGLPNRVVNSISIYYSRDRLPAESSGGIFTPGYIAENKHWYWGVAWTGDCSGTLSCTVGSRFVPTSGFKDSVEIQLYDDQGECGQGSVSLAMLQKEPLALRSLLSRTTVGTAWFRCLTDYPMCIFFCSIYDERKKSGSFEHCF